MQQYLDIVQDTLIFGDWKKTRTGKRAITSVGQVFRHDMGHGFPLLTTKKINPQTVWTELEGFIKGITSKQWYKDRNCNIWNQWSNPTNNNDDDLGPIYGYQWRRFNEVYDQDDNGSLTGYDQLKNIVNTLKENPADRRMVCSAWNPIQMDSMALPPCHLLWNVVVVGKKISLLWHQRSCDLMLGIPFNIASYATLLLLLAKEAGLRPHILQGTFADCHIYEDHVEGAKEQLIRTPRPLPSIQLGDYSSIYEWSSDLAGVLNYSHHPQISFPVAV